MEPSDMIGELDEVSFEGSLIKACQTEDETSRNYSSISEAQRPRHKKSGSLADMIDLLAGTANTIDVDDIDIEDQKAKAEQILSEFKRKFFQIALEETEKQEDSVNGQSELNSTIRRNIIGKFDFTIGKSRGLYTNLVCVEKLRIVRIPNEFIPKETKEGNIVTISLAQREADKEAKLNLIKDIQNEVLEFTKECTNYSDKLRFHL